MKYYYYWIALAVFVLDYITKKIIETQLMIGERISVIGDFFLITSHRNRGAAFGILQGQRTFFIIVTTLVLCGIVWYMYINRKENRRLLLTGLGLVLGGAFGNYLDRALYGEVVDFLQFNFGSYTFPYFNVADSGIVIGVSCIILDTILSTREEAAKNAAQDGETNGQSNGQQSDGQ